MSEQYRLIGQLEAEIDIPQNGTLSRTLHEDDKCKVVLFGFDQGQELSEHTASKPALLEVVRGRAELGLGPDTHSVEAGAFVHMAPQLPHRIRAETPLVLLLVLIK